MENIDVYDLFEFFIDSNKLEELRNTNHYENYGLTGLQHQEKLKDFTSKFKNRGSSFLNKVLTIEGYIKDISDKNIVVGASYENDQISYTMFDEYHESYGLTKFGSVTFIYTFKQDMYKELLKFSKHDEVTVTGTIFSIINNHGVSISRSLSDNYKIENGDFNVYFELLSMKKGINKISSKEVKRVKKSYEILREKVHQENLTDAVFMGIVKGIGGFIGFGLLGIILGWLIWIWYYFAGGKSYFIIQLFGWICAIVGGLVNGLIGYDDKLHKK